MAREDWTTDGTAAGLTAVGSASGERDFQTANERVQETVAVTPDADAAAQATAAGVRDAAFVDYGVALDAHAARVDIEDLDSKNRRNAPATFASADHMRLDPSDTAPTPGSVNGVAPDATA